MSTIRRIDHLERLNNSVNGNPRFRIYFTDESVAETQSDAGFCYGLENRENFGVDVVVSFTRTGRVADLRLAGLWSDTEFASMRRLARSVLANHGADHSNADELTRENCGACVLAGYGADDNGPNYAGWARVYVQAGQKIPSNWQGAFSRELASDNTAYAEGLAKDVRTFGLRAEWL